MNVTPLRSEASGLRLQAGGTLNPRRHLYIERPDDATLLQLLSEGQYVNILTSRQMGKSSLMVRTAALLTEHGTRCAIVDLAAELGTPQDATTYFLGLLNKIARDLKIQVDLSRWWAERVDEASLNRRLVRFLRRAVMKQVAQRADETLNQRLIRFFREVVLERVPGPVVCFLDEIDSTLKLPWTDDLFTALRGIHNERPLVPAYERLTFCLIGVAWPNELIKDRRTTPYNVGSTLELRDFDLDLDDLTPLMEVLSTDPELGRRLVERVLYWTGGHPYLTMRLCSSLKKLGAAAPADVDWHVEDSFRTLDRVANEVHFQQILRFFETRLSDDFATLNLYERILGGARERDQPTLTHTELKLSGLVKRDKEGRLVIRNPIYELLFDRSWIESTKPKQGLQHYRHWAAGDTQHARGNTDGALQAYMNALAVVAQLSKQDPDNVDWQRDLSISFERIGNVQIARGDLDRALQAYEDSLAIREKLAAQDPANASWQRDLSVSFNKIGDVHGARGSLDPALQAYRVSLAIAEMLASQDRANASWQRDLSVSYNKIGDVHRARGNLDGALEAYRESLAIAEMLAAQDPANASWQRDLSVSFNKIGDVHRARGYLADALQAYRESLAIVGILAAQDPANASWQRDLSVSFNKIGDVHMAQGDPDRALQAYQDSLGIREKLTMQDPSNAEWQRDLSVSFYGIGKVQRALGNLDAALEAYHASLAIAEKLAAQDPSNAQWQHDVSVSFDSMGEVQRARGNLDAALKVYQGSLAIAEKLAAQDPSNAQWQRNVIVSKVKLAEVAYLDGRAAEAKRLYGTALEVAKALQESGRMVPTDDWMVRELEKRLAAVAKPAT